MRLHKFSILPQSILHLFLFDCVLVLVDKLLQSFSFASLLSSTTARTVLLLLLLLHTHNCHTPCEEVRSGQKRRRRISTCLLLLLLHILQLVHCSHSGRWAGVYSTVQYSTVQYSTVQYRNAHYLTLT